jgi:hypothetical protein
MAENFKEMLEEQKKTNQLLVKMNEDPSLASSIKQNLGEILNASRLANRDEEYQKKEGVTEVDEEVEKVEKAIGDLHDDTVESFNALQSVISDGQIPASSLEEGKKDEKGFLKTQFGTLGGIFKGFGKRLDKFDKFFGAGGSIFGGGIGKKLLTFGALIGALSLLSEDKLLKFATLMDKTVLPFLKIVATKVTSFVGPRIKKLMDDTIAAADGEKSAYEVITDPTNVTTVLGAVALYYSRTIAAFALSTAFTMFKPSGMKGFAKVTTDTLGRMFYGKGGAAAFGKMSTVAKFARAGGILAIVAGLYGAVSNSFGAEAERRRKELELSRGDQAVGGFFGQIVGGINEMIGMFIGLFDEDLGKKFQNEMGVDATTQAAEMFTKTVREFLTDFFDFIFGGVRKLFFGKNADENAEALEREIIERRERQEDIKRAEEKFLKNFGRLNKDSSRYKAASEDFEVAQKERQRRLDIVEGNIRAIGSELQNQGIEADNINLLPIFQNRKFSLTKDEIGLFKFSGVEVPFKEKFLGGGVKKGSIALIGEGPGGRGGELVYSGSDAMVMNQSRTDQLLTMALEKGLSGGDGESGSPTIITDNSIRSNTSNMISSPSMITSNDSLMNSITNSV